MSNELRIEIPLKVSIESITKAVKKALDTQEIKLSVAIDLNPKIEPKEPEPEQTSYYNRQTRQVESRQIKH